MRLLYTEQYAEILTNGNISKTIMIKQGFRQGDPLSPLLFVMAIEQLATAVRTNNTISGITIAQQELRPALYADDVIIFLKDMKNPSRLCWPK